MLGSPQPRAMSSPFSGFTARSVPPPGFTATLLGEDDDLECGVNRSGAGFGVNGDRRADQEREHDNVAKGRCGDASHEFGRYEQCDGGHVPTIDTSNSSRPAAERSGHATPTQGQRADAGDVPAAAVLQQPSPFAPATGAGGCADGSTVMQGTDAGGVRGRASVQAPPAQKKVQRSLEECLALVRIQREDDALMADASSVHKLKKHGERREWIARRMRDEGWNRSAEDCRKKWFALGQKLKVLADKDGDSSARGSSDRGGSDRERSDGNASAGKTRRTSSRRVNDGDGTSSMSGMSVTLAESTRVYFDGLDKAAATIAEAQTAGATMVAGRLGDMATQIGAVATAMTEGNAVLQLLLGVMAMVRERIDGKEVVIQEMRYERGSELERETEWCPDVHTVHTRVYYALVNGLMAMRMTVGLGYNVEDNLAEVVLSVKKLSEVVPNNWVLPNSDVVGDVVRYLMSAIAEEHLAIMRGDVSYVAHMEPRLVGRPYLHGAVQMWCPDDDLRAVRNRW
ncbi:hypothetical protein CBR_g21319 [Chara braunii]|uniref:Myb-like domain-containing protein n=1 Tax=Chara braunii TaxID=69332 RepID=A0A388L1A7_CHABU|nr:hypothetical protein CBR_g21319 [Chara braunii]|eukprot:GBG76079.1 hypothetical protein CBR_g21319 [Chara braunii]